MMNCPVGAAWLARSLFLSRRFDFGVGLEMDYDDQAPMHGFKLGLLFMRQ